MTSKLSEVKRVQHTCSYSKHLGKICEIYWFPLTPSFTLVLAIYIHYLYLVLNSACIFLLVIFISLNHPFSSCIEFKSISELICLNDTISHYNVQSTLNTAIDFVFVYCCFLSRSVEANPAGHSSSILYVITDNEQRRYCGLCKYT